MERASLSGSQSEMDNKSGRKRTLRENHRFFGHEFKAMKAAVKCDSQQLVSHRWLLRNKCWIKREGPGKSSSSRLHGHTKTLLCIAMDTVQTGNFNRGVWMKEIGRLKSWRRVSDQLGPPEKSQPKCHFYGSGEGSTLNNAALICVTELRQLPNQANVLNAGSTET